MPKARIKKLVKLVCAVYKVKPPRVEFYRTNQGPSHYDPNTHTIRLRPRHLNAPVAIHEAAHGIAYKILGREIEDHGPEFVGIYMVLLEIAGISPRAALHCSATAAGIKFRKVEIVGPKVIRKRNAKRFRQARKPSKRKTQ